MTIQINPATVAAVRSIYACEYQVIARSQDGTTYRHKRSNLDFGKAQKLANKVAACGRIDPEHWSSNASVPKPNNASRRAAIIIRAKQLEEAYGTIAFIRFRLDRIDAELEHADEITAEAGRYGHLCPFTQESVGRCYNIAEEMIGEIDDQLADWDNT